MGSEPTAGVQHSTVTVLHSKLNKIYLILIFLDQLYICQLLCLIHLNGNEILHF